MTLLVGARLRHDLSEEQAAALEPDATVRIGDQFSCDIGDGGARFFRAYDQLRAAGNDLFNPTVRVDDDDPKVFPADQKGLTAYVAESMDQLWLRNPPGDYRSPPVGACQCRLREEAEMDLEERPRGLFVCVADEYIAHDDWLAHFGSAALTGVKPVRCRGKAVPGWNRLRVGARQAALDEICFAWISCGLCRRPAATDFHNVWFSATEEAVRETAVAARGSGHFGEEPLILLGVEAVRGFRKKVKSLRRVGLRPLPVYSRATRRYEVLRRIHGALGHLREQALEELKTAQAQGPSKEALQELRRFWKAFFG
jgi:hypothetical protein